MINSMLSHNILFGAVYTAVISALLSVLPLGLRDLYVILAKAFGLPKPSLFSNHKVMLPLCHLRVKLNSKCNCWNSHVLPCLLLIGSC